MTNSLTIQALLSLFAEAEIAASTNRSPENSAAISQIELERDAQLQVVQEQHKEALTEAKRVRDLIDQDMWAARKSWENSKLPIVKTNIAAPSESEQTVDTLGALYATGKRIREIKTGYQAALNTYDAAEKARQAEQDRLDKIEADKQALEDARQSKEQRQRTWQARVIVAVLVVVTMVGIVFVIQSAQAATTLAATAQQIAFENTRVANTTATEQHNRQIEDSSFLMAIATQTANSHETATARQTQISTALSPAALWSNDVNIGSGHFCR